MIIDERRDYCLANFAQLKKNKRVIETDHNGLILDLSHKFCKRNPDRQEVFNLKNKACQEAFRDETEINKDLLECFESDMPFEVQIKNWEKMFNSILHKCFRKVRIVNSKKKEGQKSNLLKERNILKKEIQSVKISEEMKGKIKEKIEQIEQKLPIIWA